MTRFNRRETDFRLLDNPNWCPGSYSLDLYCKYENPEHGFDEFPHSYVEFQTFAASIRQARRRGWIYHRDGTATCPKCARRLKGSSQ